METIRASKLFFVTKPGSGVFYEVWTQSTLIKVKKLWNQTKDFYIEIDTVVWTRVEGLVIRERAHPIVIWPRFPLCQYPLLSCQCPSHRTQSIRSCRNHCQELCQECQTIARDFENPFSIGHLDLGLHVFADILYLRWNLSAGLPGQLKLCSTLRAFYSEIAFSQKRQPKVSSRAIICLVLWLLCVVCTGK